MISPDKAPTAIYAWVGEDELGSGQIGIKQGLVPAGMIPLVSVHHGKMVRLDLTLQMQRQASQYRRTIRLVRYVPVEIVCEVEP